MSIFCLSSFYITDKIALSVKNKNPLMIKIKEESSHLNILPVDGTIIDDIYFIPGVKGREVNVDLSFYNMQKKSLYDYDMYVFNYIYPKINLSENKDKIIIRGNSNNKSVSLILESINDKAKYLKENDYNINVLIDKEEYDLYYELINNSNNTKTYKNIDSFLDKHRVNKYICITKNDKIPELCQDKFIVKPSIIVTHSNISSVKNDIKNGEIILISNSVTITDLNVLLNEIKYHDLIIKPLSLLIKE